MDEQVRLGCGRETEGLRTTVERFVAARFPSASMAVVGGSAARGTRTSTSDIDLLLIGPAEMFAAGDSLAALEEFHGEHFELFAYSPEAFDWWARHDLVDLRPVLLDMLLDGLVIRGPEIATDLRDRWRPVVSRGPLVEPAMLTRRRYAITDLIDDLVDATDALEQRVVAHNLFTQLSELILLATGNWLGSGKWLVRRLRAAAPSAATVLSESILKDDPTSFAVAAGRLLEEYGGRVDPGFVR